MTIIEATQLCDLQIPSARVKTLKCYGEFVAVYYDGCLDIYKCDPIQKRVFPTILRLERSNISSFDIEIESQQLLFYQGKTLFLCKLNFDAFLDLNEDGSFQVVKIATRSNIQVAEVEVYGYCVLLKDYAVVCIDSSVFVFDINIQCKLGFVKAHQMTAPIVDLAHNQTDAFIMNQDGNLYFLTLTSNYELVNKYPIGWAGIGIVAQSNFVVVFSNFKISIFQIQPFACLVGQFDMQQKLKLVSPIARLHLVSTTEIVNNDNPEQTLKLFENSYLIIQQNSGQDILLSAVSLSTLAVTNLISLDSIYKQKYDRIVIGDFHDHCYSYVMVQNGDPILVINEVLLFKDLVSTGDQPKYYPLSMLWEEGRSLISDECKISLNQSLIINKINEKKEKEKYDQKVNKPVMFGVVQPKSLISTKLEIGTMHKIMLDERAREREKILNQARVPAQKLQQIPDNQMLKQHKFEGQCFSCFSANADYLAGLTNQCSVHLFDRSLNRKLPVSLQQQPLIINLHTHSQFMLVSQKQGALLYRLSDTITKPIFDLKYQNSRFDVKVTQYQEPSLCQFLYSPFDNQGVFLTNILDEVYFNYFKYQEDNEYQTFCLKSFSSFRAPLSISAACTFTNRFSPYILQTYTGFDASGKQPSLQVYDMIKEQYQYEIYAKQNPLQRTLSQICVADQPLTSSNYFACFALEQSKGSVCIFDIRQPQPIRVFQFNDCKKRFQNIQFKNENQLLFATDGGMGVYDIGEGKIINGGKYYSAKTGRGGGGCQCFSVGSFDQKAVAGFGNQELCFWGFI